MNEMASREIAARRSFDLKLLGELVVSPRTDDALRLLGYGEDQAVRLQERGEIVRGHWVLGPEMPNDTSCVLGWRLP